MKSFEMQRLHVGSYPYLVLSTSFESPLDEIELIENELKNCSAGKVIFDLVLTNGLSSNRFIEAEFDGDHIKHSSFRPVQIVEDSVKKVSSKFYQLHSDYVEKSILPNPHKFLLKKGKI